MMSGLTEGMRDVHQLMPEVTRDTQVLSSQIGDIVGHTGAGLVALFHDLDPLFVDIGQDLDAGSAKFENWAKSSDTVQRFVAYAENELPKVEHFLGEAATAASHFAIAFAPLGGGTLSVLTLTLHLLNLIPVGKLEVAAPAITGVVLAVKSMQKINASTLPGLRRVNLGVGAMAPLAIGAGAAVGILSGWLGKQQAQQMHTTEEINSYTQALEASNGAIDDSIRKMAASNLQESGAFDAAKKLGISLSSLTDASLNQADAQQMINELQARFPDSTAGTIKASGLTTKQYMELFNAGGKVIRSLRAQSGELGTAEQKQKDIAAATKGSTTATYELTSADKQLIAKTMSARTQIQFLTDAMNHLSGDAVDAKQQELHFKDSLAQATQALKGNGSALNDNTRGGRANKEWLLDEIRSINSHVEAVGKQTGSVSKATGALRTDTAQLRHAAAAAGLNKRQVDHLIKSYEATPRQVRTAVRAETRAALSKIKHLQDKLDDLHNQRIYIDVEQTVHTRGAPAFGRLAIRDSGGPVTANTPYLIGVNRKPEVFVPNKDGQVVPIPAASRGEVPLTVGGGGGGTSVYIDLRGSQVMTDRDMDVLIDKVGRALATRVLPQAGVRSNSGRF